MKILNKTVLCMGVLLTMGSVFPITVQASELTNTGSKQCDVDMTIASDFRVTIPKKISLDGSSGIADYQVSVKGDIAGNLVINVVPDTTFVLSQTGKTDVNVSVSQEKTKFEWSEIAVGDGANSMGRVSSGSGLTGGAWSGHFMFNVDMGVSVPEDVFGKDIILTKANLATYGIQTTGDIVIPEYVIDVDNVKHKVTEISGGTFDGCTNLTSVVIPNGITIINYNTFDGCTNLTSVTLPDSVTSIGVRAFAYTNLTSVTLPDSVTSIGVRAFAYTGLTSIIIPEGVTSIEQGTFANTGLMSITIPGSVKTIGYQAFKNCANLKSVILQKGVVILDTNAFEDCENLTSVTIPDSVTDIGSGTFTRCTSLTSVTIPDSVATIGSSAFAYCTSLTSVTIPDSVATIGRYAFDSVPHITYHGTATGSPWSALSIN